MKTTSTNEHIEHFNTEPSNHPVEAYFSRITFENQDWAKESIENGYLLEKENVIGKWTYDDGEYMVGEDCLYKWTCANDPADLLDKYAYIAAVLEKLNHDTI